jgi:hypothetical protein
MRLMNPASSFLLADRGFQIRDSCVDASDDNDLVTCEPLRSVGLHMDGTIVFICSQFLNWGEKNN